MTIRKIIAPDESGLIHWLVEEGDTVEAGTPLAVLDINGESRQIRSEYGGLVKAIRLADHASFAAHVTLAVLEVLEGTNRGKAPSIVSDEKSQLIVDIEQVVERVVKPHFDAVGKRFTGIEKTLAEMNAKLSSGLPNSPKKP